MMAVSSPRISKEAQKEFNLNQRKIIDTLIPRLLSEQDEFNHLGDAAENTLQDGFEFLSSSLEACMQIDDFSLLESQLNWAGDRLPHDGISMERMIKKFAGILSSYFRNNSSAVCC